MKLLSIIFCLCLFSLLCTADENEVVATIQRHQVSIEQASRRVSITLLVFSDRDFSIRVVDNAGENDSAKFSTLSSAMEANSCIAGCNGGFFNRKPFDPVGGMISSGRQIASIDPNTWMKGLLVVRNGGPALESTDSFRPNPDITDLLQSGTWLVRAGQSETDSSRTQKARRTFVCHDKNGRWAIGASDRCSLLELATMLKSAEITAIIDIQEALNFDGGPSTGLWLKQEPDNFYLPEKWPVRNYIGISPRLSKSS